jgi:type IV secretory pathway VirB4 component
MHGNLVQYKGYWLTVIKIQSIDIDNKSDLDKEATLSVFQSLLRSLSSSAQVIFRKKPLDFSRQTIKLQSNILSSTHPKVREYGEGYIDYIKEVSSNKLDKVNYLIIRTERRCKYEEGKSYLEGVFNTISSTLSNLNITVSQVEGNELESLYDLPRFVRKNVDSFVYGEEVRRTYVISDYPREGYPNWLKPVFSYHYPIELTQHFHPIPRSKVIRQLELQLAKLQSTMDMQESNGDVVSSELKVRHGDTIDLLRRLASGEDTIMETSFYITLSAPDQEVLDYRSIELESYLRQCGLTFRTCRREVYKGIKSILPVCEDMMLESYTFDTKSLSTLLPFTVQDFIDENGILYGLSSDMTEMICVDLWNMPNPNKIILGKSGFGKSMLAKTETARHIIGGVQAIIIDHNGEWKDFCEILGGEYVGDGDCPIRWNSHLLVFGGDNKVESLKKIWQHIQSEEVRQRVLVIEEFHNILRDDKALLLQVVKEIRKSGTAPTFITQNVKDFLRSEEGQMIFDNCSVKVLLRQGENDLQEVEKLFDLSRSEKIYLKNCPRGYGYLYTDLYKTRFKVDYSAREEEILSTNPMHKLRRTQL